MIFPWNYSAIWGGFKKVLSHVYGCVTWRFSDGGCIPLAFNSIMSLPKQMCLSPRLLHRLSHRGIIFLSQTIYYWSFGALIFKTVEQLALTGPEASEWDFIRDAFRGAGFCHSTGGDMIIWNGPMKNDAVIVKEVYRNISHSQHLGMSSKLFYTFWKRKIPTKITLFGWLVWRGKILTWDKLNRRGVMGPNRCALCCMAAENIGHLFFSCPIVKNLWRLFVPFFLDPNWSASDFMTTALEWDSLHGKFKSLPFFLCLGGLDGSE